MRRKGLRSIFFEPKTTSFTIYRDPSSLPSSPSLTLAELRINASFESAESLILKWDTQNSDFARVASPFYEDKAEAVKFINCVYGLHEAMHSLASEKLTRAQHLMQLAMKRLQREFYQILSMNRAHLDPESISVRSSRTSTARSSTVSNDDDEATTDDEIRAAVDSITEVEEISSVAMSDLRSIAECMISCGYSVECINIYKMIRKSIIDEAIYKLNVGNWSSSQIKKMDWQVLDLKIKDWVEAVKISTRTLFHGERILCNEVFSVSQSIRESCFTDISKEAATLLFKFPELVIKSKKSHPEKIVRVLDMYTSIADHWTEIESIFASDTISSVRSQALTSLTRLGESVRRMFSEFEASIQKDSSKISVEGCGVHPLTVRIMNYLTLLADFSNILSDIFAEWSPPSISSLPQSYFDSPLPNDSPMPGATVRIAWLILLLLCKLDGKADQYKDSSLSYLFLASNLQHIITEIQTSNLKYILGEDWIAKQEAKVVQFALNYETLGWGQVYSSLPANPKSALSLVEAKVAFRNFKFSFEEACRKQKLYAILDPELREYIKLSISKKLLPAYREFYETHSVTVGTERERDLYVKYTPEYVEIYLSAPFFRVTHSGSESAFPSTSLSLSHSPSFRQNG